ncbi:3'-5' exonuclease [Bradyrhizobium sp. UFLA01-814]|uniref:3'-5' exonuclease n=1 Tax=Bradyrhizobium sp. UFLA01-814 TaxID=3023480 RepID=UPI00398B932E
MTTEAISAVELERLATLLQSSGEYRVLRRLRQGSTGPISAAQVKRAVFLDVETTGLDTLKDSVIELAMLPFDYDADGTIVGIGEVFVSLRDPGVRIPAEVTKLTGITDEMVVGASIDPAQVEGIVGPAAVVIAHNAGFDRPFCERMWPIFASKPWACSLREVDWSSEGFEGAKLRDIAAGHGFFFDGHHAAEDCRAGVEILARGLPKSGRTGLAALLDSARRTRWHLWALGAPYSARELLKKRGYRWNPGDDGRAKSWHIEVPEASLADERRFLLDLMRQDEDGIVSLPTTAFDRYSLR